MPFRNGTYVITDIDSSKSVGSGASQLSSLNSWLEFQGFKLKDRNSFENKASLAFNSTKKKLAHNIVAQLKSSKQCVLILSKNTKKSKNVIPFEITYAIDECQLPLIIMYPDFESVTSPQKLSMYWPEELKIRIETRQVKAVHIPFSDQPARDALRRFHINGRQALPNGYAHFNASAYQEWGLQTSPTENVPISHVKSRWPLSMQLGR
tara:strand:+ start:235 stop:858 length:624 start_codon:yes stop_codon:yes gene_type:complete